MFGFGVWEIAIIGGVVLLVLGPAVIPRLGRRVGDMVIGFRDAAEQLKGSMNEPREGEDEAEDEAPKALPEGEADDKENKAS